MALAATAGLERLSFDTGSFQLTGWLRGGDGAAVLTVYLEGDGQAWLARTRPSTDPTPRHPIALELAAADGGAAVLALARPCQYLAPGQALVCGLPYWSNRRFAPEVIAATNRAIDQAKRRVGAGRVLLIGYSGGGVVAALAAAERTDVVAWATVAAPLDVAAWTRHHQVAALTGSLDPADRPARLAALPQRHFAGARDTVVPPALVRDFLERQGPDGARRLQVVAEADHLCCWVRRWPELRPQIPQS
jgi:pimeloyl-ACP methyl ester carboxylesterase